MGDKIPVGAAGAGVGSLWTDVSDGQVYRISSFDPSGTPVWSSIGGTVDSGAVGADVLAADTQAEAVAALGLTESATERWVPIECVLPDTDCAVGDGKGWFPVPSLLNGATITGFTALAATAGTTGTMDIQLRRVRSGTPVDVFSTKAKIDSGELSSTTGTVPVIDTANDDLLTDDQLYVDVDAVHTTAAKGLFVWVKTTTPLA